MGLSTKETERTTFSMVLAKKCEKMARVMKATTFMAKNKDLAAMFEVMGRSMLATEGIIKFMAKGFIHEWTEDSIWENGSMAACMEKAFIRDLMAENSSKILTIENNMNKKASKIELEDLAKLINGKKETKPDDNYENTKIAGILRRLAAIEESLRLLVLPEGYDLIILTNQVIKQAADLKETKEKAEKN